jgi:AmiR/NasT family two-component response regulator
MAVIEQAKGALRALRRIGAEDAYAILLQESQRRNVKVHDVAAELLDNLDSHAAPYTNDPGNEPGI